MSNDGMAPTVSAASDSAGSDSAGSGVDSAVAVGVADEPWSLEHAEATSASSAMSRIEMRVKSDLLMDDAARAG